MNAHFGSRRATRSPTPSERNMICKFTCAVSLWALIIPVADAITVSVPEKSQPESITVAPNGDLILGSAASPKIYRAKSGSDKAAVFVDVSADGAISFLGGAADTPSNTLWACEIYTAPPGSPPHSALRAFDLRTGAAKFRWELPGEKNLCNDFVVGPDKALYISDTLGAKIWRSNQLPCCRKASPRLPRLNLPAIRSGTASARAIVLIPCLYPNSRQALCVRMPRRSNFNLNVRAILSRWASGTPAVLA